MADLDIIIPVYNEDREIVGTLETLAQHVKVPFRVLLCYDDDDDRTLPVAAAYARASGLAIDFVKNTGAGVHAAIMAGFRASDAPAAMLMPADDRYNAASIDRMFELFRGGCDVVCASRFIPGGCMKRCRLLKATLVRATAFTLYHFARLPARDPTNGLRLYSRRVLQSVPIESTMGFTHSIELLVKCHRLAWKIGEVPSVWIERQRGGSRFRVFRWAPAYLRWYWYAFQTTYFRKGPESVYVLD